MKLTKRFYMGSLAARNLGKTYNEAVEEAEYFLTQNPGAKERVIVEIIAVVKRSPVPTMVEKITGDEDDE